MNKTEFINPEKVKRKWLLVDAEAKVLGVLASEIATFLKGKHKAIYSPAHDVGDYVVVINAKNIALTGNKWEDKMYHHHTGFVGGLKTWSAKDLHAKAPTELLMKAVKGMLPKGPLGREMLKKLRIFPGQTHTHAAQMPVAVSLNGQHTPEFK